MAAKITWIDTVVKTIPKLTPFFREKVSVMADNIVDEYFNANIFPNFPEWSIGVSDKMTVAGGRCFWRKADGKPWVYRIKIAGYLTDASDEVLGYVIHHELCHCIYHDHGIGFIKLEARFKNNFDACQSYYSYYRAAVRPYNKLKEIFNNENHRKDFTRTAKWYVSLFC